MPAVAVADGLALILDAARRQPTLRLPLARAQGHILAESITAASPLPPWTAASMDGYATHADDVRGASHDRPVTLPVVGGSHAGDPQPPALAPGNVWRVATGGRVPPGADSVIRQEDTRDPGPERRDPHLPAPAIEIVSDRDAGRNVRPMGGDVAAGDVVLERGTLIGAGQVALLAALGVATPLVYRRPRVGIMASGDEVTTLDHPEAITSGERLADANTPMLTALVTAAGGIPVPLGLVRDHPDAMIAAIRSADDVDLLLSAGAVSVGPRDHVPAVMAALGAELRFRRAMLRPGGPTTLAILSDGRPWLALPGNPVSAFVTFHLFAKPAIRAMMGDPTPVPAPGVARLAEPIDRHPSLDLYLRVALTPDAAGGPPVAQLTGNQGSWVITSIARADGLVVVEAGEGRVAAGTRTPLLVVNGGG